eukprot:gnl/MRDRNA2_/MRDRNA2_94447_c0_seq1.p1 gnl/MRDRNA2_/MRDRNA2_94447_c0~~gnl/MRDRNA2_/MRDRNA2_94447_c0_seq1.p1  ORF type:complete len:161 (-),score=14.57 gnl/MRDRNA2_/MRDRNA2_94447_c0_seq1:143-625(-)
MSGALTGQAWKIHQRPRRFVEPPLVTVPQCVAHKQCMKKELVTTSMEVAQKIDKIGDIYRHNSFFSIYRPRDETISDEHEFTIDRVQDSMSYDQMIPRDTNHPRHTDATRRRCKSHLRTTRPLRSSQSYGSLPPIEIPNYGFGRSQVCMSSFMDHSHLCL